MNNIEIQAEVFSFNIGDSKWHFFKNLFSKKNAAKKTISPEAASPSVEQRPRPDVNQPVENPRLKDLLEKWRDNGSDENTNSVLEEIVLRVWSLIRSAFRFPFRGKV